ncbi:bifunctional ADP-dependent NAD(P)H-hydrate dehydratase/NAD(P)H-hydrate epimerase [Pseudonocardia ailaonensis]|uniref:Bifunctional NAD(P)H-hydrate repair enzyme n=1 Tax=Pseudonocardia ailaonensis TaxID=367279 RepID=A0ABN2NQN6_9PSEU
MYGVWTADRIRAAERPLLDRLPQDALMRRAAHGLTVAVRRFLVSTTGRRVVLLVGAGDNGGDALWAGAELRRSGAAVTAVLLAPERAHATGLAAFRRARGRVVDASAALEIVRSADVVVDGIVGISGRGGLRPPADALVAAAAGVPVVAVDLPSGVDADTGLVEGTAVDAALTVTFGARKPVHVLAAPRCGPVELVDIGLDLGEPDAWVLEAADVGARWPIPGPADDKYTQGVVGIAAGSATYPGAAVLAAGAATLATSGMVRFAGSAADGVRARWPEIVATDTIDEAGRTQAWTVGPGIGTDDAGRALLEAVLARDVPVCVDADAITLLAGDKALRDAVRGRPIVLTPHAGEFARIAGEVGADRIGAARRAAAELGVTVLLKGNATVVADPSGRTLVHPSTDAWAATAGSGDVLSGILGALLAAGLEPWWAAGCAAHVHALAASLAAHGLPGPAGSALGRPGVPASASALQAAVPEAIRRVREAGCPQAR